MPKKKTQKRGRTPARKRKSERKSLPGQPKQQGKKKFSGERDDTDEIGEEITEDGFTYSVRANDSRYPKPSSIPVSQPILRFYALLREMGQHANYDELFLDIAKEILKNEKLPFSRLDRGYLVLGEVTMRKLKHLAECSEEAVSLREESRNKAEKKGRYVRRKT